MLGIVRNDIRISLYEVHAEQEIRVVNKKEKALYQTASGRLLLAYLPLAKQKEFIKKYGLPKEEIWEDGADEEGLFMELKKIKKKEMAIQVAPSKILGIALPVGEPGDVIASLGVYLPEFRFSGEKKDQIIEAMKEATEQINGVLRKQAHKVAIDNSWSVNLCGKVVGYPISIGRREGDLLFGRSQIFNWKIIWVLVLR